MRKFRRRVMQAVFLLFVVFASFVVSHRRTLYLRDPLGKVSIDGVKKDGAQVYINYSNDVVLDHPDIASYRLLVQHGEHAGRPDFLGCFHHFACMTDDEAAVLSVPMQVHVSKMTGKAVEFRDGSGRQVAVALR
ncbi:MAG: hypothetical protein ABI147_04750 [Acidobacteriaceae bacterium]